MTRNRRRTTTTSRLQVLKFEKRWIALKQMIQSDNFRNFANRVLAANTYRKAIRTAAQQRARLELRIRRGLRSRRLAA